MYRLDDDAIMIAEDFAKKTQATSKKVIDTCKGGYKDNDDACK